MKKFIFYSILFLGLLNGCKNDTSNKENQILHTENQLININKEIPSEIDIENFIKPYREHIDKELNKILTKNSVNFIKQNLNLNMPIGNLFAEAGYEQAAPIFFQMTGKNIDFSLFNWGGIRSDLPQGNVTLRSAYTLMPFENKLIVVELLGEQIFEMAQYLINQKTPHPLSKHIELHFSKNNQIISLKINNKNIIKGKKYFVCTTDYLANGGDKMDFFKKATNITDINYKFRNALIDYFSKKEILEDFKSDNRFKLIDNE